MHTATQTIEIQKILTAKFNEEQAVKILDYVNNKQGDTATKQDLAAVKTELKLDIVWLKWAISTLLVFIVGGFTLIAMESLAARQDRKEIRGDISEMKGDISEMKGDIRELQRDISEIKENMHKMDKKLDRLIQTR